MALVNRTKVTLSLDNEIAEWLAQQAENEDRNKSRIVERLIREYKEQVESNRNHG